MNNVSYRGSRAVMIFLDRLLTQNHQIIFIYELTRCFTDCRMDQSAVGHDYVAKVEKHESQRDYSTGFGGKFGVQSDRQDKVMKLKGVDLVSKLQIFYSRYYSFGKRHINSQQAS